MRRFWAMLVLVGLLAGCQGQAAMAPAGPIPADSVFVYTNAVHLVLAINPSTFTIVKQVQLPQRANGVALAPSGKLYLSLWDHQSDPTIGILDLQTGALRRLPSPAGAPDEITISPDGTAFIDTGTEIDGDGVVLVVDTNAEKVLGMLRVPYGLGDFITPLPDGHALIPCDMQDRRTNFCIGDRALREPKPLFPTPFPQLGPSRLLLDASGKLGYMQSGGWDADGTDTRQWWLQHGAAPADLEAHLEVYDMTTLQRLRRIELPAIATEMVQYSDGKLYIGQQGLTHDVGGISVVDPATGEVRSYPTHIQNVLSLQIRGDTLWAASRSEPKLEVFHLPDMQSLAIIKLPVESHLPYIPGVPQPLPPALVQAER